MGGVTPQHVGRLRRVFERFGETHDQYAGLYWSHFQAALDWPDAEMYLEGAVQNDWSVAQMRNERWEAMGGAAGLQAARGRRCRGGIGRRRFGGQRRLAAGDDFRVDRRGAWGGRFFGVRRSGLGAVRRRRFERIGLDGRGSDAPAAPLLRPFESLPPLPADLKEAFELMKLAIWPTRSAAGRRSPATTCSRCWNRSSSWPWLRRNRGRIMAAMTPAFETPLNRDLQWALQEGSMFFEEKGGLHLALRRITQRLHELNIPYAVAGGMAMFFHGFRRFTEDVDILVTREGPRTIASRVGGLGLHPVVLRQQESARRRIRRADRVPCDRRLSGRWKAEARGVSRPRR